MDNHIKLIDQYLDLVHQTKSIEHECIPKVEAITTDKEMKIPLDMKILQQRIDSVAIIKYYKDLKNEKLRDDNFKLEENAEDIYLAVQASNDNKPWTKLDKYTKRQKIKEFVGKLFGEKMIEDKDKVELELLEHLENKKINKKNIEFDDGNKIITLMTYSLIKGDI